MSKKIITQKNYDDAKRNEWGFGNGILYEMCKNYPSHDQVNIVLGKIWLIGRSYAAAIERHNKYDPKFHEDIFPEMLKNGCFIKENFQETAAKIIQAQHEKLDKKINLAKQAGPATKEALSTHKYLTDLFRRISGCEKRSLASKYLHFHAEKTFYIYDSIASNNINSFFCQHPELKPEAEKLKIKLYSQDADQQYLAFTIKCHAVNALIEQQFQKGLSPREFDNIIYTIL